jgi:hypothetical protein
MVDVADGVAGLRFALVTTARLASYAVAFGSYAG